MAPLFRRFEAAHRSLIGGDAATAARTLRELVAADSENPVFVGALAEALQATGELAPAISAYERATALSPSDGRAWYNLGVALRDAGRLPEATRALREALRLDPRDAEAQNGLGIVESMRGDAEAARAAFAHAVELDPQNAATFNNLGNALRAEGRFDEAANAYQKALVLSPDYPDALNGWGVVEVARQRPAAALPMLQRALALAPNAHEIQLNLAVAYELHGDVERARQAYSDFLAATASDPQFQSQRPAVRQRMLSLGQAPTAAPSRR
jgi:Flp pilus assembly protein TadD